MYIYIYIIIYIYLHEPIGSMYGIYAYIYHKNQPNVGKYTVHASYGEWLKFIVNVGEDIPVRWILQSGPNVISYK